MSLVVDVSSDDGRARMAKGIEHEHGRVDIVLILRHNGVDIGKRDHLSHVSGYIRQRKPAGSSRA